MIQNVRPTVASGLWTFDFWVLIPAKRWNRIHSAAKGLHQCNFLHFVEASVDALPWSDCPPTQEKPWHHTPAAQTCPALTKVNCYSPSVHMCAHTHAHTPVCGHTVKAGLQAARGPKVRFGPGSAHLTARECFQASRGCRILNLAGHCPHRRLSCCFMNPLLHTSAQQPKRPFVILIAHL